MSIFRTKTSEVSDDKQNIMHYPDKCIEIQNSKEHVLYQNSFPSLIQQQIKKFRICLKQVLKRCPYQYAQKCQQSYHLLIHNLKHYSHYLINHDDLNKNSIDLRQKLLKMIKKKDLQKQQLQKQIQSVILVLRKKIQKKDNQLNKWKKLALCLQQKVYDPQQQWMQQKKQINYKNTITMQKSQINELKNRLIILQKQNKKQQNISIQETLQRFLFAQAKGLQDFLYLKK